MEIRGTESLGRGQILPFEHISDCGLLSHGPVKRLTVCNTSAMLVQHARHACAIVPTVCGGATISCDRRCWMQRSCTATERLEWTDTSASLWFARTTLSIPAISAKGRCPSNPTEGSVFCHPSGHMIRFWSTYRSRVKEVNY